VKRYRVNEDHGSLSEFPLRIQFLVESFLMRCPKARNGLREMVVFGRTCLFKIRVENTGILVHSRCRFSTPILTCSFLRLKVP
jgi:hypothetical protein